MNTKPSQPTSGFLLLKLSIISFALFWVKGVEGQSTYQLGWLPSINVNKKLQQDFKVNFNLATRQVLYKNQVANWQHQLVDFTNILSRKIGFNNALAGGYLLRFRDKQVTFRLIEQYTLIQKIASLQLAHRFRTDQTFERDRSIKWRLRYRLAGVVPLKGQTADPSEFYLKVNNEYLLASQNQNQDLEIRAVLFGGYKFSNNNKLELGLDNRFDSLLNRPIQSKSWIIMTWYLAM